MLKHFLTFEKNIAELEGKIEELRHLSSSTDLNIADEIGKLQKRVVDELSSTYSNLDAWEKVQVARHSDRPHSIDYINLIFEDIIFLHGDKKFSDDNAVLGCMASLSGQSVMIIGTEKGNSMDTRLKHNFGMAKPEGYRKAQRIMNMADKYNLPIAFFLYIQIPLWDLPTFGFHERSTL